MGVYINPVGMTKEQWLATNAVEISNPHGQTPPSGKRFVVLVDNGPFTAAAVAFNSSELDVFTRPDPTTSEPSDFLLDLGFKVFVLESEGDRPKTYFLADYDDLMTVVTERELLSRYPEWS
jgi:hypothetical protein